MIGRHNHQDLIQNRKIEMSVTTVVIKAETSNETSNESAPITILPMAERDAPFLVAVMRRLREKITVKITAMYASHQPLNKTSIELSFRKS